MNYFFMVFKLDMFYDKYWITIKPLCIAKTIFKYYNISNSK